ncbi:hypothetical protein [Roseomonas genomospecies 6]|uniref:hypothetical protein n=1 Tax=Roseomonas genomospecies 6 TaxID=214106 RepID=UPI0011F2C5B6|nr:hypothetical protein [Roseomonas genomospecies 6]
MRELDAVQTDMVRAAVDAGQATIDADNRAWEQRVSVAKRGTKDIIEANDPIAKAHAEYAKSLEQLNKFKPDIGAEEYETAFKAITKGRVPSRGVGAVGNRPAEASPHSWRRRAGYPQRTVIEVLR